MELETGNKVRIMRTDNVGEYVSTEWKTLYAKTGIKKPTTREELSI
jgi:hypothetical protein